jgi:hypothetical protein
MAAFVVCGSLCGLCMTASFTRLYLFTFRVISLPASIILSCQVEEQRVNQPLTEPVNLTFVFNEQVIY